MSAEEVLVDRQHVAALVGIPSDECLRLLASCPVGRLAVSVPGRAPLVVPVNFVLDGRVVVFRSDAGAKIDALRQGPVSFQVDQINPIEHTGWSVLVQGVAYEATHWETAHVQVEAWAPGVKGRYVRIVPDSITGRRIVHAELAFDTRGYL